MPVLLLERRHHRHHRFHKARALRALGPKTPFAPEHPGTDRPLRRVVRRFDLRMTHERPQRLAQPEDRPASFVSYIWPASNSRSTS